MALDATVGGATSNSYITVAEADAYFTTRLYSETWTAMTTQQKEAALIWATRLIDSSVCFLGEAATSEQALAWPRKGLKNRNGFELPSDTIPVEVKNATAEQALFLGQRDTTLQSEAAIAGLTRIKAGPIELGFADSADSDGSVDAIVPGVKSLFVQSWLCDSALNSGRPWVGIV